MAQRASRVEPRMIRPMHFGNAWDFLCRALSESKLKAQLELSANDTCALSAAGNMQINISKNKGG